MTPTSTTTSGRIYQARYLTGVAAGLKSLEMGNNSIGYVAAYNREYAETCSGINAFALGVQAVNPDAVVHVNKISTWGDENLERQAAQALIDTYDAVSSASTAIPPSPSWWPPRTTCSAAATTPT